MKLTMHLDAEGLNYGKQWEGLSLDAYLDTAGVPTIGYGHTAGVTMGDKITQEQADLFFHEDLAPTEACVNSHVEVALTQNQYTALVWFVFNVGCGAFSGSSVLKAINKGNLDVVPDLLSQWKYITNPKTGKKEVSNGLVNRRAKEIAIWSAPDTGMPSVAPPEAVILETISPPDAPSPKAADAPVPVEPPARPAQTRIGQGAIATIWTGITGAIVSGANQAQQLTAAVHSAFDGTARGGQVAMLVGSVLAVASIGFAIYVYWHKRTNLQGKGD
jgi:lysozyme